MALLKNFIKFLPELSIFFITLINTILYVLDDLKLLKAPFWVSTDLTTVTLFLMLIILFYKDRGVKE